MREEDESNIRGGGTDMDLYTPVDSLVVLRERLGKRVREVWIAWAKEQPNPKPSWLVPWEELSEPDKEVDRRIGSAIWGNCVAEHSEAIANQIIKEVQKAVY